MIEPASLCAFCGRRYSAHLDARPVGAPVPRCGCTLLKDGFEPMGPFGSAQQEPPRERTGAERIADERRRQVEKEGWTPDHDDHHNDGGLALAAVCYAAHAIGRRVFEKDDNDTYVRFFDPWPWNVEDDKRRTIDNDAQAIRFLEKAGALIAAEIDRLIRARETP